MKRIITIAIVLAPTLTACGSLGPEYVSKIDQQPPFTSTTTTTTQSPFDKDNDGFSVKEGDCDDDDPTVNPDATEYCDGVDSDCSGSESSGIVSFYNTAENKWYDRTSNLTGDAKSPASQTLADSGDYHFCDGTFYVSLRIAADMTLRGQFGEVILDGLGQSQVIINTNGVDLTIQNLTISNGNSAHQYGGGVYQTAGNLTLTDVDFVSNYAMYGGAVSAWNTAVSAENVHFHENVAVFGGAIDVSYGTYTSNNTSYTSNIVTAWGGAVYGEGSTIYEVNPYYEDNYAGVSGAAIYSLNTSHEAQNNGDASTSGSYCTFLNNEAFTGGGVWSGLASTLSLVGCDLTDEIDPLDNTLGDIFIEDNGFFYNYEGDTTVICDYSGCGDVTESSLDAKKASEYGISPVSLIGNIYLSQTINTIDTFSYYIKSDTACTPTFSVHEKTADSDWTIIWEGQGGMTSALDYAYVSAGNVGVPTVPGNEYILGISNDDSCGLLLFYWGGVIDPYVTGFGVLTGYAYQSNWNPKQSISIYKSGLYTSSVTTSH
jgi:predicted small lipoprotein YifL